MIPVTYPNNQADNTRPNRVVVYELTSTTGLTAWVDYIPAAVKASPDATKRNRYADDGWLGFYILADITGKTAWVDYIPIDTVAYVAANAWKTSAAGFIPYVDETV